MRFNWRSMFKVRFTKRTLFFMAIMSSLSFGLGLTMLQPLDFDMQMAIEHMKVPLDGVIKIALFVSGLSFVSYKLFNRGYYATAEYIGAFACLFAILPVTGAFAGLPKGVDPLGVLLFFNGAMASMCILSAFVSITLLSITQVNGKPSPELEPKPESER